MSQDLQKLIEQGNYSEAIELIDSNKNLPLEMIQAKIFCLISLEKMSLALSTIKNFEKNNNSEANTFAFEKSYCYYRLGKLTAARKILQSNSFDPKMILLLAQVLYKLGEYSSALDFFERLYSDHSFDRDQLEVNILACKSQLNQDHSGLKFESFDSAYNFALTKLTCKGVKTSQEFIEKCIELHGQDSGSDGDRINAEIVSICAIMTESKENWPEANFLLRKLKTSKQLTPVQTSIIDANIIISSTATKNLIDDFKLSKLAKTNLSEEQRYQILSNYYHSGASIPNNQLLTISIDPEINYDMKLKSEDSKVIVTKKTSLKKPSKPLDKERWLPLKDRSYYISKEKYLKKLKRSSAKRV